MHSVLLHLHFFTLCDCILSCISSCSSACDNDYGFSRELRAILHILSKTHHTLLKLKNNQTQTQQQRARFRSKSLATVKGKEVVRRIQNYVAQNVAARSLPFTVGEMTLDCVSAALCTIAGPDPLSEKAVDVLTQAGLSNEAAPFFKLRYASGARNPEGPSPKQCKTRKRRRLQLRRGAIKKRIKVLGEDAQMLKKKFLTSCPYITIVIDEGNNWGKACPLYLAVIACNVHYEWRIMFIGQADCSGKKGWSKHPQIGQGNLRAIQHVRCVRQDCIGQHRWCICHEKYT